MHRECLDDLPIAGERHLPAVLGEFQTHDNELRPQQERRRLPPNYGTDQIIDPTAWIYARSCSGLISEYYRAA